MPPLAHDRRWNIRSFLPSRQLHDLRLELHLDDPWLVSLMATGFILRLIFWIYTDRTWEDALITVLHSENFYHGLGLTHFKIDDPRPLQGFTSPLSVLVPLFADFFHVGWGLPFQKLLSLLFGPAAVWFGYRILRDFLAPRYRALAVLGAGYLAIEHHQILWGMAGMETQLATTILLAAIYFLLKRKPLAAGLSAGLCVLARPDHVLWAAIATVVFADRAYRQRTWRPLLVFSASCCAVYLPWLIFATMYYGSPIPNTVIAKPLGYVGYWRANVTLTQHWQTARNRFMHDVCAPIEPAFGGNGTGFYHFLKDYWLTKVCFSLLGINLVLIALRREARSLPLYAFALGLGAVITLKVPVLFGWYSVPLAAVLVLLVASSIDNLLSPLPQGPGKWLAWAAAAAYLAAFAVVLPTTFHAEWAIQHLVENKVRLQIGKYLAKTPADTTIAGEPLGYIGYYSRRTFYDYPGLTSRKVVNYLKTVNPFNRWLLGMVDYVRPDYIVLRKFEYERYTALDLGAFLKRDYHFDREFAVSPEDRKKLFHPEMNIDLDYVLLAKNK